MEKYISLKEKKEDEKKYQMECKNENEKRTKEYNARGERIYKNAINRENAKIKMEGHSEFH